MRSKWSPLLHVDCSFFWKTFRICLLQWDVGEQNKGFHYFCVCAYVYLCVSVRGVHLCVRFRVYVCARTCACVHMKFLIFSLIKNFLWWFSLVMFFSFIGIFWFTYFFYFSAFNYISSAFYTVLKILFFQLVFSFDVAAEQSRFLSSLKTPKSYSY